MCIRDSIDHQSSYTIPKLLKKINPNYKTAHFGKWGIDVHPSILGYDVSDGITKNKDGVFNPKSNIKQWQNNIDVDPKKYLVQLKKQLTLSILKQILRPLFSYRFLTMLFIQI